MRGNKLEKSHIHILQSETPSRESGVTESTQEIVDSIPCNCEWYSYINSCQHFYTLGVEENLQEYGKIVEVCLTCEDLVGILLEECLTAKS